MKKEKLYSHFQLLHTARRLTWTGINPQDFRWLSPLLFFFFKTFLFIYLFLKFIYLFLAALRLHCCVRASHCSGFSSCGAWTLGMRASVVVARRLTSCGSRALEYRLSSYGCMGLVALRHVGSSRTRAQTLVPCIGRQILNYCTTREVPLLFIFDAISSLLKSAFKLTGF